MRTVQVEYPSFPIVDNDALISIGDDVWQVLCGDRDHWRIGVYSSQYSSLSEITELEQHSCPEFFLLLQGRLTLLLAKNRKLLELPLEIGKGVLVTAPHAGFCPDGPQTGKALVVERDTFTTKYASPQEFTTNQTLEFEPVEDR